MCGLKEEEERKVSIGISIIRIILVSFVKNIFVVVIRKRTTSLTIKKSILFLRILKVYRIFISRILALKSQDQDTFCIRQRWLF